MERSIKGKEGQRKLAENGGKKEVSDVKKSKKPVTTSFKKGIKQTNGKLTKNRKKNTFRPEKSTKKVKSA